MAFAVKDDKDLSEQERQEKEAKEAELKQAYYDAMVNFYAIRKANAQRLQGNKERLVSTDEEYLQEIKAEDAMYRARETYIKLGKADPYTEERQALREQEKQLQKANMNRLQQKTQEYRQLEIELAKLQKARNEKEEDIAKAIRNGATKEILDELNRDLKELDHKIKITKQDLAQVKDKLVVSMDVLERRNARRRELNLESREYQAQSAKEQANIRYANEKTSKSRNDFVQANKLETSNINKEVQRNEDRYEQLKKELKELKEKEPENFEKRLALLEQLDDASQQLKASREVQKDVERGIEPDTDEAIKRAEKDYKTAEERKEEFTKKADDLIEAAKAQEKAEGEQTVEDPTKSEEEKEKAVVMGAIAGAVILGDERDSISEDIGQAAVGAFVTETCVIPELQDAVKDLNDPAVAAEYVEQANEIEAKQREEAIKDATAIEKEAEEAVQK